MLILNRIKKILIFSIFIVAILSSNALAVVNPTSQFYVNDYANVLSQETEEYIIQMNIDLQNKTGAQIVVVTVNSLDGQSIEEYATELFRNFGIGDSSKNNGILLLCSTGDREFRIEVGYGLEGKLPDGKTGRIQDEYIIPYLSNDNYDEGIKNGFSAVLQEVADEYNVTIDGAETANAVENEAEILSTGMFFSMVITIIISQGIISIKKKRKRFGIISVYSVILAIIIYWISKSIIITILIMMFNIIFLIAAFFAKPTKRSGYRRRSWWRLLWSAEVFLLAVEVSVVSLVVEVLLVEEEAQGVFKNKSRKARKRLTS